MTDYRGIDWNERRSFNDDNGVTVYYNIDELLERSRPIFIALMRRKFYRFFRYYEDLFQECCLSLMRIYAEHGDVRNLSACLLGRIKYSIYNNLGKSLKGGADISLDETVSNDIGVTLTVADALGVEDDYFPVVIDWDIFTDSENALIDDILRYKPFLKDADYTALRNKLSAYFGGELDGAELTPEPESKTRVRERGRANCRLRREKRCENMTPAELEAYRAKAAEQARKYHAEHPEKRRASYRRHREAALEYARARRVKLREAKNRDRPTDR